MIRSLLSLTPRHPKLKKREPIQIGTERGLFAVNGGRSKRDTSFINDFQETDLQTVVNVKCSSKNVQIYIYIYVNMICIYIYIYIYI